MIKKYSPKDVKFSKTLILSSIMLILMGCQSDVFDNTDKVEVPTDGLSLIASVKDGVHAVTRDLTQSPELVTYSKFPTNFYIRIEGADDNSQSKSEIGTYTVPSGYQGQLQVKGSGTPLLWFNASAMHNFWSWTLPWMSDGSTDEPVEEPETGDSGDTGDTGDDTTEPDSSNGSGETGTIPEIYTPSPDPVSLTLADTHFDDYGKAGSWNNGEILEQFVGARSGPFSYKENGRDVPLQHKHLMSKIVIESITFNAADGSTHYNLTGEITFINMPNQFTFYPRPTKNGSTDGDDKLMEEDGEPIVVTKHATASPNSGLTFAINNPPGSQGDTTRFDEFYICPEVDFENVEFKVKLNNPEEESYADRGEYWGNFKNVIFERIDNTDYDVADGSDDTVLHAGEVMYFNLILQQFGGGGTSIYIRNWNTGPVNTTKHYPHRGLYTEADLRAFSGTSGADAWKTQYELLGDGTTFGEPETLYADEYPDEKNPYYGKKYGIVNLYGNASMSSYTLYVGGGYVLDGMGYTVKMTPPASNPDYKEIYLGNMRDIYITMGKYSIYVDPNGWIYSFDEDAGDYIKTEMQLDGTYTTYRIDLEQLKFISRTGLLSGDNPADIQDTVPEDPGEEP